MKIQIEVTRGNRFPYSQNGETLFYGSFSADASKAFCLKASVMGIPAEMQKRALTRFANALGKTGKYYEWRRGLYVTCAILHEDEGHHLHMIFMPSKKYRENFEGNMEQYFKRKFSEDLENTCMRVEEEQTKRNISETVRALNELDGIIVAHGINELRNENDGLRNDMKSLKEKDAAREREYHEREKKYYEAEVNFGIVKSKNDELAQTVNEQNEIIKSQKVFVITGAFVMAFNALRVLRKINE